MISVHLQIKILENYTSDAITYKRLMYKLYILKLLHYTWITYLEKYKYWNKETYFRPKMDEY